jgi:maltooligosyltrehalose trehalohydrolase
LIALRRKEPDLADPWLDNLSVDYDEDRRWLALKRGRFTAAFNLGEQAVTVPVSGKVVLEWGAPSVGDSTELPGHSFALLATD